MISTILGRRRIVVNRYVGPACRNSFISIPGNITIRAMQQYLDLLRRVRTDGIMRGDRTGTGTQSVFGHQMRFDLSQGFPCLTTKKLHLKSIIHELLWFLAGDTNIKYLKDHGVSIWDDWADENGELAPFTVINGVQPHR